MLHVFGDSWAYGSELSADEKPFSYYLSLKLNQNCNNLGRPGISLGHITSIVLANLESITQDDYVVVVIPPDIRWYNMDENYRFHSLSLSKPEYRELLKNYKESWFIYHHNLFIFTLISAITKTTDKLILAHNYGSLVIQQWFKNVIDMKYFLSKNSLTGLLQEDDWKDNYSFERDGPKPELFKGKYFEGKVSHPNQQGHLEIARLIYEKFNEK